MKINRGEEKRIAKNTIFLYFRMLLVMVVTLYTSRVILKVLGIEKYGIYQTVCGVVTFLAFMSNALGVGTSRFVTFEMGKEEPQIGKLFSTVRIAHIVLAFFAVAVGEIIGLWVIKNKLVIPHEQMNSAIFAFHCSMITVFFQITQIPYNAIIIAYERMNVYAVVSVLDTVMKLAIVYALKFIAFDMLKTYAALYAFVTIIIMMIYRVYCRRKYDEVRQKMQFDIEMFKSVASFSSWNLITSSASSLANQGVTVATNIFFGPAVVTVRTLAITVSKAIGQFISSFRTAVNPQIVKKYAAQDYEEAKRLSLSSTKYTYYLLLLIVLPIFLLAKPTMKIWLGEVPEGTIPFVKLALLQGLFQAFDTSLYAPIYAKGQIKENSIISPIFDFIQLPTICLLFYFGCKPISIAWVSMLAYAVLGIVVKPILVNKIVGYEISKMIMIFVQSFAVTLVASVLPAYAMQKVNCDSVSGYLSIGIISEMSILLTVWFIGIDKTTRMQILMWLKRRIKKEN